LIFQEFPQTFWHNQAKISKRDSKRDRQPADIGKHVNIRELENGLEHDHEDDAEEEQDDDNEVFFSIPLSFAILCFCLYLL
jgi:hypothetical protein